MAIHSQIPASSPAPRHLSKTVPTSPPPLALAIVPHLQTQAGFVSQNATAALEPVGSATKIAGAERKLWEKAHREGENRDKGDATDCHAGPLVTFPAPLSLGCP